MAVKRSRRGCLVWGLAGPGILVLGLVGLGGWFLFQLPDVDAMVADPPLQVDLLQPDSAAQFLVGDPVPVQAQAAGVDPLVSLELWVDGKLVSTELQAGLNVAQAAWTWQPASAGIHTMMARATDSRGRVGQSALVVVNVFHKVLLEYNPSPGETLETVANKFGTTPEALAQANPGVDPQGPLGSGPVKLPPVTEPGDPQPGNSPPPGGASPPEPPSSPFLFWLKTTLIKFFPPGEPLPPAAPAVSISSDGCAIMLTITPASKNADGFIVYRWRNGDLGFKKIATLGPGQAGVPFIYQDPTPPNSNLNYYYYVAAFNVNGESKSSLAVLEGLLFHCDPSNTGKITLIHWTFTAQKVVDKAYCYQSTEEGVWERMPVEPHTFFPGNQGGSQPLTLKGGENVMALKVECWGWAGMDLEFLGGGSVLLDLVQPPGEVLVQGNGFLLSGIPEMTPLSGSSGPPDSGDVKVPAPFALREAATVAECAAHYGNPLATLVCENLVNASVKQYYTLVWEWQPATCLPGMSCSWVAEIDGYYLYELDPISKAEKFIKEVSKPTQKSTAVPLPWGAKCYGVKAYAENPILGHLVSNMATYCPGSPPQPQKTVLKPVDWLSTDGDWIVDGCETYGTGALFVPQESQVVVGVYMVDNSDCFKQGDASAAVKFPTPVLHPAAVIQKAQLKFSQVGVNYKVASDVATNLKPVCATRVGTAKQEWTSLSPGHFIDNKNILLGAAYYAPYASKISPGGKHSVDVTGAVLNWLKKPANHHGFILVSDWSDLYNANILKQGSDGSTCYSLLDNLELEIEYFTPGN